MSKTAIKKIHQIDAWIKENYKTSHISTFAVSVQNKASEENITKYKAALAEFKNAIEKDPENAVLYNNRGSIYAILGQYEEAINDFAEAAELKSDYSDAFYNLGLALKASNQLEEALVAFDKAIEIAPTFCEALNNRGVLRVMFKDYENAINDFKLVNVGRPVDAKAYFNLGNAYFAMNKIDEALAAYDKAIEINPLFAEAYQQRQS